MFLLGTMGCYWVLWVAIGFYGFVFGYYELVMVTMGCNWLLWVDFGYYEFILFTMGSYCIRVKMRGGIHSKIWFNMEPMGFPEGGARWLWPYLPYILV